MDLLAWLVKNPLDPSDGEPLALHDVLPNGKFVRTIKVIQFRWRWLDNLIGRGSGPLYESKVFASRTDLSESRVSETRGYGTVAEARQGHRELVGKWSAASDRA